MIKIAIVLPYFGELPNYFNFWVQSVKYNPTIDWLLFTDNNLKCLPEIPLNLKVTKMTFEEFAQRFENFFSFKIELDNPYKLCDFKVFYGEVLRSYLLEYEFWGFCDCDLIFGDIRKFVTDAMLMQYNFLFGLGPLQLHRVKDDLYWKAIEMTRALNKYDYKHVLSNKGSFVFDELPHGVPISYYKINKQKYYNEFSLSGRPYDAPNPDYYHFLDSYNSMNQEDDNYKRTMYYKYRNVVEFWDRGVGTSSSQKKFPLYRFDSGKLDRLYLQDNVLKSEELLFVHFRSRKFSVQTNDLSRYIIVPNKFIKFRSNLSIAFMWWNGHDRAVNWQDFSAKNMRSYLSRGFSKFKRLCAKHLDQGI